MKSLLALLTLLLCHSVQAQYTKIQWVELTNCEPALQDAITTRFSITTNADYKLAFFTTNDISATNVFPVVKVAVPARQRLHGDIINDLQWMAKTNAPGAATYALQMHAVISVDWLAEYKRRWPN